ncbi:hypothetical protein TSMEX_004178 [Taenia solium]|eukprot:TsM_000119000 transcript=TsM_000119000 gene=TsM_000119000
MPYQKNSFAAAVTVFNAGNGPLYAAVTGPPGCQHASLSKVAMARENADVEAGRWKGAETAAAGAFEVVAIVSCGVAIVGPIGTAEGFLAQCGLTNHS